MLEKQLQCLGLNEKESRIYLAALEAGATTISELAERAKMKRTSAHLIVRELLNKRVLLITSKKLRRLYYAAPPEELEQALNERLNQFREALPLLKAFENKDAEIPRVRLYHGTEGVLQLYTDQLRDRQEIHAFVGVQGANPELRRRLTREYIPQRLKRKIHAYVIAPDSMESRAYQRADTTSLRQTKLIPQTQYPFSIGIEIYGDKVALISYPTKEYFGLVIESKEAAKSMRSLFQFFWSRI